MAGTRVLLAILVLAGVGLRLQFCAARTGLGTAQPVTFHEYIRVADRLVAHGTLESPLLMGEGDGRPSAMMPPLYAAFVAGVYALLGVESYAATLVLQVVNALASALVIPLVFMMVRPLAGERWGLLAAGLVTLNPMLIGFTHLIWDTGLFVLGATVAVWLSMRVPSGRPRAWAPFAYGAYLGALALLNPALTLAYPLLVLRSVGPAGGWRFKPVYRGVALSVVGWALVITPWTLRNVHHFDRWFYLRNGFGLELWLGACPEADTDGAEVYLARFPLDNADEQARLAQMGEQAYLRDVKNRAVEAIRADPVRWAKLCGMRAIDYWFGTVLTHRHPGQSAWPRSTARLVVALVMTVETVVILIGLCLGAGGRAGRARLESAAVARAPQPGEHQPEADESRPSRARAELWYLVAVAGVFSIVYYLTHVVVRFRAPMEPVLAAAVVLALKGIWDRLPRRETKRVPRP